MRLFPMRAQKQLADRRGWNDGVTGGAAAARWKKESTPSVSPTDHWVESDCDHQSDFFSELYKSLDCDHTSCWSLRRHEGTVEWLSLFSGNKMAVLRRCCLLNRDPSGRPYGSEMRLFGLWCVSQTPLCASRSSDRTRFLHLPDWRWQTMTAPAGCGRLLWEQAVFPRRLLDRLLCGTTDSDDDSAPQESIGGPLPLHPLHIRGHDGTEDAETQRRLLGPGPRHGLHRRENRQEAAGRERRGGLAGPVPHGQQRH